MWEAYGSDLAGLAALITALGHVVYTIYRQYVKKRQAIIDEESELVTARGNQIRALAASACQMVEASQAQVTGLTDQLTSIRHEQAELRADTLELRKVIRALERENERLSTRIQQLEAENKQLRKRLQGVENGGSTTRELDC